MKYKALLLLVLGLYSGIALSAPTLPDSSNDNGATAGLLNGSINSIRDTTNVVGTNFIIGNSAALAVASNRFAPVISTTSLSSITSDGRSGALVANAFSRGFFHFSIVGPVDRPVPLILNRRDSYQSSLNGLNLIGQSSTLGAPPLFGQSLFSIEISQFSSLVWRRGFCIDGATCNNQNTFNQSSFSLNSNTPYVGVLFNSTSLFSGTNGFANLFSEVNLNIDLSSENLTGSTHSDVLPDVFSLRDFRLVFSPGVANGSLINSGIPEPDSWLMLIMGFTLIGASRRSRTKKMVGLR